MQKINLQLCLVITMLCSMTAVGSDLDKLLAPIEQAFQTKQINKRYIDYINNNFCSKLGDLGESELNIMLSKYISLINKNPELKIFNKTESVLQSAIKASYKMVNLEELKKTNSYIFELQEMKRQQEKYYKEDCAEFCLSDRFLGDISSQVAAIVNGDWSQKVLNILSLAELAKKHHDKLHVKVAAERTSELLAKHAYHLSVADLYTLLYALSLLDKKPEFGAVMSILEKIKEFDESAFDMTSLHIKDKIIAYQSSLVRRNSDKSKIENYKRRSLHRTHSSKIDRSGFKKYKQAQNRASLKLAVTSKGKEEIFVIKLPIYEGIGKIAFLLQKCSLFSRVNKELILLFARHTKARVLYKDEVLYKQGDPEDSFALILDGELGVHVENKEVMRLVTGQTVGEMSLFTRNAKRNATVMVTSEHVYVLEITQRDFEKFANNEPQLLRLVIEQLLSKADIGNKNVWKIAYKNPNILSNFLEGHDLFRLGTLGEKRVWPENNLIVKAGQDAQYLYYVSKGQISLIGEQQRAIGKLGENEFYDEIAFFKEKGTYSHSACTEAGCTLYVISRERLNELMSQDPSILWALAAGLSKLISENNFKLANTNAYHLQQACVRDDVARACEILKTCDEVNINDPCAILPDDMAAGTKLIHVLAKFGSIYTLNDLFLFGLTLDALDDLGNTAVHIAAAENKLEFIKALYALGGPLNIKNLNEETPLKIAQESGNNNIVEFLKSLGFDASENLTDSSH